MKIGMRAGYKTITLGKPVQHTVDGQQLTFYKTEITSSGHASAYDGVF